ncbi:MAG TPA: GNAT family N-acetyltransferase [Candidatus Acidoferrum sp.]|jgi:predicted N-acetyltransferase YhbS
MPQTQNTDVSIRVATKNDAPAAGKICFDAFAAISNAHNFPPDLPSAEVGAGLLSTLFSIPGFYCVVAESGGQIVGSNCLDERSVIFGLGPITVDPAAQNLGVGRKLMCAVMDRAKEKRAVGVRLVQTAYHNRSLSLYASLGFDIREPLSCMQGRTKQRSVPGCTVRKAENADLESCNAVARRVHGFDRGTELSQAIEQGTAKVVERGEQITGYAADLAFFAHATAQSNMDLQALIASAEVFGGPGILVPTRNNELFRWCLANGLRVAQPMTLMTTGLYNEPTGAYLPSVLY